MQAIVSRLRRTGLSLVSGFHAGLGVRAWLKAHQVPVDEMLTASNLLAAARANTLRPIVIFDFDSLADSLWIVRGLESHMDRRPPVVIVNDMLDNDGPSKLGWTGSTARVGFVRANNAVPDLVAAFEDVLAGEPALPLDFAVPPTMVADVKESTAVDVNALKRAIVAPIQWAAPQIDRRGDRLEVRAQLAERDDHAWLSWRWLDDRATSFELTFVAPLPPASGWLRAAPPQTGWRALLEAASDDVVVGEPTFDAVHRVSCNELGLAEARACLDVLDELGARDIELRWGAASLEALAKNASQERAHAITNALLTMWRAIVRHRM